ncbi:MAG: hypothetical protein PVJ51_12055, partial [Acidobacteriota bacterium]
MAKLDPVIAAMTAQAWHEDRLLQCRNVVGVGTGYRFKKGKVTTEVCVQVLVDRKVSIDELAAGDVVPGSLAGAEGSEVPTDVLKVTFEAQQDTGRYRPVPAGISIGPEASISAGTLGGWACDDVDDTTILLSNNHVISNLDTMPALRRILQPGQFDGGVLPADVIGRLKRDVTVNTVANVAGAVAPLSVVDAAIGTIEVGLTHDLRQLNVPVIYELQAPALGMNVLKRGRTTRLTTNGRITTINTTIPITYRNRTRLGRIQNSFIISSTDGNLFSNSGDSGSLILNQAAGEVEDTFPVVGLLYGGGTLSDGTPATIANNINAVFGALNLSTVCACVARAVIRAIFSTSAEGSEAGALGPAWGADGRYMLLHKERQLRAFREQVLASGKFGEGVQSLINVEAARVGKLLAEDDEAFALLVRALRPFVRKATTYDMLETELDRHTVEALLKFSSRVARKSGNLRPKLAFARAVAKSVEGKKLG